MVPAEGVWPGARGIPSRVQILSWSVLVAASVAGGQGA